MEKKIANQVQKAQRIPYRINPRLLYLARISFKTDGKIKELFRRAKVKRIQYHQTSFTTNVEGTYIVRKYREEKDLQKQTPNN